MRIASNSPNKLIEVLQLKKGIALRYSLCTLVQGDSFSERIAGGNYSETIFKLDQDRIHFSACHDATGLTFSVRQSAFPVPVVCHYQCPVLSESTPGSSPVSSAEIAAISSLVSAKSKMSIF